MDIGGFFDGGLNQQEALNLTAHEQVMGRTLSDAEREEILAFQHQAMRWTFFESALVNKDFLGAFGSVSAAASDRIENVAPAFC